MEEIWKNVRGYEGLYQVSNMGGVKGLDRYFTRKQWGKTQRIFISGKLLSQNDNGRGYLVVILTDREGHRKTFPIHHLVCDNFLEGKRDKHNKQVDHIDNNCYNNSIENLRIVTASENSIKRSARRKKTSRFPNVNRNINNKWEMSFMRNGKRYRKSNFQTEIQAYLERQKTLLTIGESF